MNLLNPSQFGSPKVAVMRGKASYEDAETMQEQISSAIEALALAADFIRPGDRVVIKPNWVKEHNASKPEDEGGWLTIITHPMVVREVARWAAGKLRCRGSVTLCDAPQSDSSFDAIRRQHDLDQMITDLTLEFPGVGFQLFDMRCEEWTIDDGVTIAKRQLASDPAGAVDIHLDGDSEFIGHPGLGKLYGASYDFATTNRQHTDPLHEYRICRTPMNADVLINVPKLKTHKKVGLTVALKNLVGTTPRTNWLPRHTEGTPAEGGDQFAESTTTRALEGALMRTAKKILFGRFFLSKLFVPLKKLGRLIFGDTKAVVRSGNWHGNNTAWRMIIDLHKCFFYFDGSGRRREQPLRYLTVVDGIIGGDGDGPMSCDPVASGVILAGTHPVAVDCVAAQLMGFNWRKTRLLADAFALERLPITGFAPQDITVSSNEPSWCGPFEQMQQCYEFRCHFGWAGHLESDQRLAKSESP
jgi:uncharacterized protein (DUF362 family)